MKVLAVSSSGGHWVQLMRLKPALDAHEVTYVSTMKGLDKAYLLDNYRVVPDANMERKIMLFVQFLFMSYIILTRRPDVIITTGASVGFFALFLGKLIKKKTIWLDSIANTQELSLSGKKARRFADLWLTQWPDLATEDGPQYKGQVL